MRTDLSELVSEVRRADHRAGMPLGTAQWMDLRETTERLEFRTDAPGDQIWIGEALDPGSTPLGYEDDRHICLVSGTRGGKGAGVIIPNLCVWPGSCIVIDPKGENATVTARRRGAGSEYARPLGQKVCILDPFGEVQLPIALKARYNPLDAIDPESDTAVDDAARIATALVVIESKTDPYWELAARNLIKGVILHVLSARLFEGRRNLVTVRRLLTQGDWLTLEQLRNAGDDSEEMPSAFEVLWSRMRRNQAFNGVVAGVGEQMIAMADKQRSGVIEAARTNTEFLDSLPMQRLLEASDFDLAELKTNPQGLSIYLTLPQRYMETHYRWLRLMIVLALGEMERIKGRPAAGHATLFVLDEFAGLKRMEAIEHAVAQAAGFGVKFLFVAQNLPQLKTIYDDSWESFVSNSGAKIFFQIDDDFTRAYITRLLGEREVVRETRSSSRSASNSRSTTDGLSETTNSGTSFSKTGGGSSGDSFTYTGLFRIFSSSENRQRGTSWSDSRGQTQGSSQGTSSSRSESQGDSTTAGWGEAVHKRSLLNPDEIGRFLARIDDADHPAYPGLVLAAISGLDPLLARRVNYFEAPAFAGCFDPHPNYPPPPLLQELTARHATKRTISGIRSTPYFGDASQPARSRSFGFAALARLPWRAVQRLQRHLSAAMFAVLTKAERQLALLVNCCLWLFSAVTITLAIFFTWAFFYLPLGGLFFSESASRTITPYLSGIWNTLVRNGVYRIIDDLVTVDFQDLVYLYGAYRNYLILCSFLAVSMISGGLLLSAWLAKSFVVSPLRRRTWSWRSR